GMGDWLGGTGLLASVAGAAGAAAGQAGRAAAAATGQIGEFAASATRSVEAAGQRAAGAARSAVPNWVYWAVPAIVAAGLLWYLVGHRVEQVAQQPVVTSQSIVVARVDIGRQIAP